MKKISFLIGLLYFIVLNVSAQKSEVYYKYPTDENIIYDICFTYNGGAIVIADNKSVKVYSMVTNELIGDFKNGHSEQILSIDISRDSTLLVSGGKDSTIVIWDFKERKLLKSFKCNGIITSLCLSPNNQYLAYGGADNKVSICDIIKEEVINILSEHSDDITSIAFSSDGRYIAASSDDKLITIHENGSLVATLSGHKDWIRGISFDSNDTKLISCSDDGKIITWNISDINNPRIYNESKFGFSWLLSVDFNQDNKTYALGDFKGNAAIIGQFGRYKMNVKSPIKWIIFKPNEGSNLKVAVATRGKGVLFIDAKNMKLKHN